MSIASVRCRDLRVMQVVVGIITLSKFLTRACGARSDGGGGGGGGVETSVFISKYKHLVSY